MAEKRTSMSKSPGPRGERGIPGPRGPAGLTGATRRTGAAGPRGVAGKDGAPGPSSRNDRREILNLFEGQIEDIYKELAIQMKRMAQLQVQIDDLRRAVRPLTAKSD
jgi:hypothetical protein